MLIEASRRERRLLLSTVISFLLAALIAGTVFGVLLHTTGRIESVAQLYGSSGVTLG